MTRKVGILNVYSSPTTAVGGDLPAGRQGCRATGIPRQQAGLANREAILPSGEPLINNGPENKIELRYNTSQQKIPALCWNFLLSKRRESSDGASFVTNLAKAES